MEAQFMSFALIFYKLHDVLIWIYGCAALEPLFLFLCLWLNYSELNAARLELLQASFKGLFLEEQFCTS